MTAPAHPAWCDPARCQAAAQGPHEATPARVTLRGRRANPKLLLVLWAPAVGTPVKIRIVALGELLVTSVDLSLDEATLLRSWVDKLLERAAPPA